MNAPQDGAPRDPGPREGGPQDGGRTARARPGEDSRPHRVTVTHPRTLTSRSADRTATGGRPPVADDLRRQTPLGDVYLRSLMRTQLRLGLAVVGVLVVVLGGLPLLFVTAPGLQNASLAGVPVPWLLTAVAVHPVILALAFVYKRQAAGNERDFADLVERS